MLSCARKAAASTGGDRGQCLRLHHLLQARPPLSPAQRLCLSSALDALWLSLSTALSTATPAVLPLLRLDGLLLLRRQSSPPPPLPPSPTHCLCDSSAVDMLVGIVLVVRRRQHDCVSAASTAADTLWHRLHVSRSQLSCSSASCSRSDAGCTTIAAAAASNAATATCLVLMSSNSQPRGRNLLVIPEVITCFYSSKVESPLIANYF